MEDRERNSFEGERREVGHSFGVADKGGSGVRRKELVGAMVAQFAKGGQSAQPFNKHMTTGKAVMFGWRAESALCNE